jgi:hypothetical protein
MDELRRSRLADLRLPPVRQREVSGQNGIDRAERTSSAFADAMMEASANLVPDPVIENARIISDNLLQQTAAMNVLASRTSTQFNPAIIGYAAQLANQVNLEGNMPPHRPLRQGFDDRFRDRDRVDGHFRVPPTNETKGGPVVL